MILKITQALVLVEFKISQNSHYDDYNLAHNKKSHFHDSASINFDKPHIMINIIDNTNV